HVRFGDGAGGFSAPVDVGLDPSTTFTTAADIDGDGDLDLISTQTPGIAVRLNDGTGAFGAPTIWAAPPGSSLLVSDLNGDQAPDVVYVANFPGRVIVMLNTCAQPPADLEITQNGLPLSTVEGAVFNLTLTARNNGPNASAARLTSAVSNLGVFVSATSSQGACQLTRDLVTCDLGTLAHGGTADGQLSMTAAGGGSLGTVSSVSGTTSDPAPANN